MKVIKFKTFATLLAVVGGMAVLSAQAQNKYVTSGTVIESGSSYQSISNRAALEVTGSTTSYRGTKLTLSATFDSGNGRYGVYARNQAALDLSGATVTTSGSAGAGVYFNDSTGNLDDVTIQTDGPGGYGLRLYSSATLTAGHLTIGTEGDNTYGVQVSETSCAVFDGLSVTVSGSMGAGAAVRALADSYINLGTNAYLAATGAGALFDLNGQGATSLRVSSRSTVAGASATIISAFGAAAQVEDRSTLTLTDSRLQGRHGIAAVYQDGGVEGTTVTNIIGGTIDADENAIFVQPNAYGYTVGDSAIINISGAVINSGTLLNNNEVWAGGSVTVNLDNADLADAGGIVVGGSNASTTNVTVNGGSGINGDVTNSGSGALTVNLDHSSLTGDAANLGDGVLVITLDNNSTGTGGYNGG
ncbi:MAG: hypothetical protein LBK71_09090, partial [Verrucomicrobiales bacterium]|nr:hypothetical protein [Verrucomicrobiales bacterium]